MGNAEKIIYIGRSGAGRSARSATRWRSAARSPASAKRSRLAKKAGVDAARVRQALLGGFAASRVLEVHGERMLVDNYKPGFRAKLYQKDMRLANEAASANGVSMPANAVVAQLLNALIASAEPISTTRRSAPCCSRRGRRWTRARDAPTLAT
jgi:2-hydroxy-3-oxopropionate reductase